MVAAVSTMQIILNHRKNAIVNFSDDVIFQKFIFGRIQKQGEKISKVKEFQEKFLNSLKNLKDIDNNIYQTYISTQAKFQIETFETETDNLGGRREVLRTFDITDQMKSQEFDINNASYVFKLHFSLNDTSTLKDYIQNLNVIKIKASDLILLSKESGTQGECKKWTFEIEYYFNNLEKVTENLKRHFIECKASNFDQKEDTNSTKIFDEIFMFNLVSFGINFIMIIFIASIVVEILKYQNLKEEKLNKYRWLLRNKKNYDSESTLD